MIAPLHKIRRAEQATRIGLGVYLRIAYGDPEEESFLPFTGEGLLGPAKIDAIRDWIATFKTGIVSQGFLSNVVYIGGIRRSPRDM